MSEKFLEEYLEVRQKYVMMRNDLVTMLTPNIIQHNGRFPDIIKDVLDWDDELKVVVTDRNHMQHRIITIPMPEVLAALR